MRDLPVCLEIGFVKVMFDGSMVIPLDSGVDNQNLEHSACDSSQKLNQRPGGIFFHVGRIKRVNSRAAFFVVGVCSGLLV